MSMSNSLSDAFYTASGIHADSLTMEIRLLVGGIAILSTLLVLVGLIQLLDTNSVADKVVFLICLFGLMFALMMIFIYIA